MQLTVLTQQNERLVEENKQKWAEFDKHTQLLQERLQREKVNSDQAKAELIQEREKITELIKREEYQ